MRETAADPVMSLFRRIEIVEEPFSPFHSSSIPIPAKTLLPFFPTPSPLLLDDELLLNDQDFFNFSTSSFIPPFSSSSLDLLLHDDASVTDLTHFHRTPFTSTYKRFQYRARQEPVRSELVFLKTLSDRVAALESKLDLASKSKSKKLQDRSYSWTAQIKDKTAERSYNWTAQIKSHKNKDNGHKTTKAKPVKSYKWTSEVKGRGEHASIHTYTIEVSTGKLNKDKKKCSKEEKHDEEEARTVEIEEITEPGGLVLRQVFGKRAGAIRAEGKKKELSPQDAAFIIQQSFRAYLIRRSQALRGLRELAVAKNKLKELRKLFNNFSYRRRIALDAEECQRFSEKIIVVLLTVDAIEGVDLMVRAAKRSMVDELEAMLDVVDPQPAGAGGRSLSIKRRTFDLPTGGMQKEIAAGVAQVVKMLNQEENGTED